ncbi:uncharacterized protein PITG_15024 [Phytophthora infestans T30-4]|uniref:Uncharacterized protein n=1 Tax=Phytophthora infestans (strain T30-4) TaxID=403677 RepID=D0NRH0_PHYIT|nr:uncharacterized protein PITG_15024 [Phytophthora infestans T30-4]EEY63320.1 hypothetical protein PITG_15024 [Phytophthora infestans T30-4]|eukprot:XP_002898205.1 hypothetical protein PITG_15024 [Phytophthora infestans T30-4]
MSTLGDNLFVGSSTQENLDENRIETFSITPLPCTVHEAEQILWRYVTNEDTSSAGNEAFNFTTPTAVQCAAQECHARPVPLLDAGNFVSSLKWNQEVQTEALKKQK